MIAFSKIKTTKRSVLIAEQILSAIREETFKVGERIPSERDLSQQMGVSRPAVREALVALQLAGVLETKRGKGTFVATATSESLDTQVTLALLRESDNTFEALEVRRILEVGLASLAATRMTKSHLQKLKNVMKRLQKATDNHIFEKGYDDYITGYRADYEFHLLLAEATDNQLAHRTLKPLIDVLSQKFNLEYRHVFYERNRHDYLVAHCQKHQSILRALESQDPKLAAKTMEEHFDLIQQALCPNNSGL